MIKKSCARPAAYTCLSNAMVCEARQIISANCLAQNQACYPCVSCICDAAILGDLNHFLTSACAFTSSCLHTDHFSIGFFVSEFCSTQVSDFFRGLLEWATSFTQFIGWDPPPTQQSPMACSCSTCSRLTSLEQGPSSEL